MLNTKPKRRTSWNKGMKTPINIREKLSKAHIGIQKGEKHPMFGKHHSKVTKEKMRFAKINHKPWNVGKKLSKKHCENLSKSHIGLKPTIENRTKRSQTMLLRRQKHWNWKGGVTPLNHKIRESIETTIWRDGVFSRDGWTCQKCDVVGSKLHPHHIKNFSEYPELRFSIDNGITLCKKCHQEFHKKYGFVKNDIIQIKEFLQS